jgi:hypothetical protein
MFHVEHPPIDKSAPILRASLQDLMGLGGKNVYGQGSGQVRYLIDTTTANPGFAALSALTQTHADMFTWASLDICIELQTVSTIKDQGSALPATKGAPSPQEIDSLKDRCFTGAVWTPYEIDPPLWFQLDLPNIAEIVDSDQSQGHREYSVGP